MPLLGTVFARNLFVKELGRETGIRISACGICGDAESRASADQRAEEGDAFDSGADAEATRVQEDAEEPAPCTERAAADPVS